MTTALQPGTATAPLRTPRAFAVVAALAIVYFTWGSTYLAIRVAVEQIPPFLLAATRFLVAGAILYAATRFHGAARPSARAWGAAGVVGVATFVVSHGLLAWASQFVNSGTAALVSSASPAWIALGGAAGLIAGHRPSAFTVAGTAIGLAGVALALDPAGIVEVGANAPALVALLSSSLSWAAGSVLARWSALPDSASLTAAMSMMTGGGMLLAISAALGEPAGVALGSIAPVAWGALAYLTVAGSLVAYSAYVWLLREDGPTRVSAHSFVNPIVAVLLGAAVAGEPLTGMTAMAATLVVAGVALVSLGPRLSAHRAKKGAERAARTPDAPCVGC